MATAVYCPALGLILLCPALGVLFNVFFGRRFGRRAVNLVGPGVVFLAFAVALWSFGRLLAMPAGGAALATLWPWIRSGSLSADFGVRFDALSAVMTLVVTGVGALIHLYSVGYMAHDEDYARYFAYLNLFTLSMLILVLADNLVLMFVGWEGVGLCSYLLISFWYTDPKFAYNGRKAFVVNRIGDAGFLLGIFTIIATLAAHNVWTLDFTGLSAHAALFAATVPGLDITLATLVGLLLLLGATGKSAQIPLYVWLPDAMVGPTPVSALIHAATMVTAGVYMVARLNFMYRLGPDAMNAVAAVGAITAFFAATVAVVQADIKRVLAYSTISQLGYMFLGVGVGAFASGIFHLMTHAFFKSLLFLCAGSVMHALEGEQDMNRMGALWTKLPVTWLTMLIATLAITAVPGFSGYFSKDLILESAFASRHTWLWALGVGTAGLTGFYMFRLIFMTFHGSSRVEAARLGHVHEPPPVMTIPLIVLAVLSVVGGWVGLPEGWLWGDRFGRFLSPVVGSFGRELPAGVTPAALSGVATGVTLVGIAAAYFLYILAPTLPARIARSLTAFYDLLWSKYYVDELYDLLVSRPLFWLSTYVLSRAVDTNVIDGLVNGTGLTLESGAEAVRRTETGNVRDYALVYLLGAVAVAAYYLYLVMR